MYDDFSNISDILNANLFSTKKLKLAFKQHTIFSFWGKIAGKKFENSSKPYAIKNSKMYVSCADSYVVQELSMYKNYLLKKIEPYAKALDVEISDIIFNYKNWSDKAIVDYMDDFPEFYTDDELSCIEYIENDFKVVFENIDNSTYLTDEQKTIFKNKIIKLQKAKKLRFS